MDRLIICAFTAVALTAAATEIVGSHSTKLSARTAAMPPLQECAGSTIRADDHVAYRCPTRDNLEPRPSHGPGRFGGPLHIAVGILSIEAFEDMSLADPTARKRQ